MASSITVSTPGRSFPEPNSIQARLIKPSSGGKSEVGVAKVTWEAPGKSKWWYAVYYGRNMQELLESKI